MSVKEFRWLDESNLPGPRVVSRVAVTGNRVYLLGGYDGSSYLDTVVSAPINPDGTLGNWRSEPNLPGARGWGQTVVTKNRVYLLGGHNGSSYITTVVSAPINPDGTLGNWVSEPDLPGYLDSGQAVVTKNRVYLLGGYDIATVVSAPINEDGSLGGWVNEANLPGVRYASQVTVTKNRVYLLGGRDDSGFLATVISAPINEDGTLGSWRSEPNLPRVRCNAQALVANNRVYLLGGSRSSSVISAPIGEDGTIGSWRSESNLPEARSHSQAISTKNRMYLLGGLTGLNYHHSVSVISTSLPASSQ